MKVIRNWGKMVPIEVIVPPVVMSSPLGLPDVVMEPGYRSFMQGNADGVTWYNLTKDIPLKDDQWFIAVQDGDGFIACCERDPSMVSLTGYDIIQIETDLTRDEIFCQKWADDDVVPPPKDEQVMATPSPEDKIAQLEARLAALEKK